MLNKVYELRQSTFHSASHRWWCECEHLDFRWRRIQGLGWRWMSLAIAHLIFKILIWNCVTDDFSMISTPVNLWSTTYAIKMSRIPSLVATSGASNRSGIPHVHDKRQLEVLLLTFWSAANQGLAVGGRKVNVLSLAAGYLPTLASNKRDSNLKPSRLRWLGSAVKETFRKTLNEAARAKAELDRAARRTRAVLHLMIRLLHRHRASDIHLHASPHILRHRKWRCSHLHRHLFRTEWNLNGNCLHPYTIFNILDNYVE